MTFLKSLKWLKVCKRFLSNSNRFNKILCSCSLASGSSFG